MQSEVETECEIASGLHQKFIDYMTSSNTWRNQRPKEQNLEEQKGKGRCKTSNKSDTFMTSLALANWQIWQNNGKPDTFDLGTGNTPISILL